MTHAAMTRQGMGHDAPLLKRFTMTEAECLARMVAPGTRRPGKYREGVIQIHVTRACDKACFNCTQGSNYGGKTEFMSPDHFAQAVDSLKGYFGVLGVFGGNPAMSPHFEEYCRILRESWVPFNQRGLWCNNIRSQENAEAARATFDPSVSNINVHLDKDAWAAFRAWWPEAHVVGTAQDSRHSPVFVAMKDVVRKDCSECRGVGGYCHDPRNPGEVTDLCGTCDQSGQIVDDSRIWELISGCDINQHWSAMIGVFRGQLRAWFCEIAGAQSILHQDEPDYPDTGHKPELPTLYKGEVVAWWQLPMLAFAAQVRKHCFDCGVPLRGWGELAQAEKGCEQVSQTHASVAHPKRRDRPIQIVDRLEQLGIGRMKKMTHYLQNATK